MANKYFWPERTDLDRARKGSAGPWMVVCKVTTDLQTDTKLRSAAARWGLLYAGAKVTRP